MAHSPEITASLQDYLETILSLITEKETARVTDIADRLNIAKPSVNQALALLRDKGLIIQDRYGPVELTTEGRRYARKIRHRHRVISGFLHQVLGVSIQAAEKDACLMEHDLSNETFEKLLKYLNTQVVDTVLKKEIAQKYE